MRSGAALAVALVAGAYLMGSISWGYLLVRLLQGRRMICLRRRPAPLIGANFRGGAHPVG